MGRHLSPAVVLALCFGAGVAAPGQDTAQPDEAFRAANEHARGGDLARAIDGYRQLAAHDAESASLYWNWAQAALQRPTLGEAMWALLRGREVEPGDLRLSEEVERVRTAASLDPAEIAPEPLAVVARFARRFHLDLLALILLGLSLGAHLLADRLQWGAAVAWTTGVIGLLIAAIPLAGALARNTAVVVTPNATLFSAASPTADAVGELREGEAVPILGSSGDYLRIEDSSGARGWARLADVWPLDRGPAPQE